jgi:protein transport protein SEC31
MDVMASIRASSNFTSLAWGSLGVEGPYPQGLIAGGLQDGVISLWNPQAIVSSRGADAGLVCSQQVHQGAVNCVEFNPIKPTIVASCGVDSEVNIVNLADPTKMETFKPSTNASKHAGTDVLCCAWNRKVQHILCSCSNAGSTVVWDLKKKQEVICFKDPAGRARCSAVAWHPNVPTQLIVCYDDERNPSIQMWDLRNAQYPFKESSPPFLIQLKQMCVSPLPGSKLTNRTPRGALKS